MWGACGLDPNRLALFFSERRESNMNKKSLRKIIIGLLLCFAINVTYEVSNEVPTFAADIVVVNATNVNVRSQPSTDSKSYGKVTKGTTLQRTEARSDGWSCVDYAGTAAYIKSDLLVPYTAAAATVVGTPVATTTTKSTSSGGSVNYIANKNTHKFHYPGCDSVNKMSEKNKWYFNGSRDELISQGYVPCKRCNP